jgi:hypothetical protein
MGLMSNFWEVYFNFYFEEDLGNYKGNLGVIGLVL